MNAADKGRGQVPPEAMMAAATGLGARQTPARADARGSIEVTVTGLGYELVDVEREPRGLLRVTIDRLPGRSYPSGPTGDGAEFVTVDDCELVTRQLQYSLEVDGVAYERLEVSSPGLDRPLKTAAHLLRFVGQQVSVTLKQPFQGRKAFKGVLGGDESGWTLVLDDGKGEQVLGFALAEVREARLVPVLDFKGRKGRKVEGPADAAAPAAQDGGQDR
jgi:ribosome maturation factor RimP